MTISYDDPSAFELFVVTDRTVRDRLTRFIRKFSARINAEKKLSGQSGEQPKEYHILLQDILDLSRNCDVEQDIVNEKRKAIVSEDKQKALDIRDIDMKNLKETRQITEK